MRPCILCYWPKICSRHSGEFTEISDKSLFARFMCTFHPFCRSFHFHITKQICRGFQSISITSASPGMGFWLVLVPREIKISHCGHFTVWGFNQVIVLRASKFLGVVWDIYESMKWNLTYGRNVTRNIIFFLFFFEKNFENLKPEQWG